MGQGNVGFVGLGIMGRPMARNLLTAGYSLTVYDVVGTSVEEVVHRWGNRRRHVQRGGRRERRW